MQKHLRMLAKLKPEMEAAHDAWIKVSSPDDPFFEDNTLLLDSELTRALLASHADARQRFLDAIQASAGRLH